MIKSAQEGLITKTDLDAAIEGVKKDGLTQNDLKKATDNIALQVKEHFKTTLNKRYIDFYGQIHKILLSDLEKKIKDAAISKPRTELMSYNHLNSPADIRKYIGSQMENKVDMVISDLDTRVKRICVGEDMKLRCAAFLPFTATVRSNKEFYVINGDGFYIQFQLIVR